LTKIIEAAGTLRSEVFITNIVKCRPPGNRKPLPLESKTCKELLLHAQIKIIRPQVICTLGASALAGLLEQDDIKITKVRGVPMSYNNCILLPTYHPAYILRNPAELATLMADVAKACQLLKK
jgi:uracil-DNA glycosylase family 4